MSNAQTYQVSRFLGQSHDEGQTSHGLTMRDKNLTVNRFTGTFLEYFHFCLVKLIFWRKVCREKQLKGMGSSVPVRNESTMK